MIKFTLTAKQIKDYFGMIKIFGEECRLHIEKDKLRVALVDNCNIGLINSEVEVDTGAKKPQEFGLMIHRILAFTKVAKDTVSHLLQYNYQQHNMLLGFCVRTKNI